MSLVTALLFGVGSALTLDEFALWVHFVDAYWSREGRQSVDAVILFGSLLWTVALGVVCSWPWRRTFPNG